MTRDEFHEAVNSLGDKFFTAITSQTPINVGVTLAATFHMIGTLIEATPKDERYLIEAPLKQGLEELLRRLSWPHRSDTTRLN
jgi:hypothetical protein